MTSNQEQYHKSISVEIIADSKAGEEGSRLTTFRLMYPRFIHSELMTHRVFSRNASSSRAVPLKDTIKHIRENPIRFAHLGINCKGMQAKKELTDEQSIEFYKDWAELTELVTSQAMMLSEKYDLHKQVINRVLEPFTYMNTIVSATDWDNFFTLRTHSDAQPEFRELAIRMKEEMDKSNPVVFGTGNWHLPFISETEKQYDLETQILIAVSCCAQVSYRNDDRDPKRAARIFKKLAESEPKHLSPLEHIAWYGGRANPKRNFDAEWIQFRDWISDEDSHRRFISKANQIIGE